jgi:integrase
VNRRIVAMSNVAMEAGSSPTKLRVPTGGATQLRGRLFVRVTVAGKRTAEHAPWATSLAQAQARGRLVQTWVARLERAGMADLAPNFVESGAKADDQTLTKIAARVDSLVGNDGAYLRIGETAKPVGPVTLRKFAERWTSGELARLYPDHIEVKASVDDDVERFEKHIYPHVEDVPLASFTREHADGVMAKLPSTLKRGTRRHIAQLINRVLHLAVFTDALKHHPLPRGWLPKAPKAESIGKESLLPSEEAKLLSGVDAEGKTVVELVYRIVYAFMHREGMRKSEAKNLTWGDLNLEKGVVSLDLNKTDRPRSWVVGPSVAQVLKQWKKMSAKTEDASPVFVGIAWEKLAGLYRRDCQAVGIKRERLFQKKANKLQLRAHDMRAFFVTAAMYAGKDALWITDRTGHTSLGMLRTYERDVRRWRELGEAPIDVALAIPEFAATSVAAEVAAPLAHTVPLPAVTIEKCTGRESNPYALRRRNLNSACTHDSSHFQ